MTYDPQFHQQVRDMGFRFHDSLDNRDHPVSQNLNRQFTQLRENVEIGRPPRQVWDQINTLETQLRQNANTGIMSIDSSNAMREQLRMMRDQVRQHPDFN